jgi:hypothetical protein
MRLPPAILRTVRRTGQRRLYEYTYAVPPPHTASGLPSAADLAVRLLCAVRPVATWSTVLQVMAHVVVDGDG